MAHVVVTPASESPISLEAARRQVNAEPGEDDDVLLEKIEAAVSHVEQLYEMALAPQVWRLSLPGFCGVISLPGGKCRAVDFVKYVDSSGQLVTLSDFDSDLDSRPARIGPLGGWPATANRLNAVQIQYQVGYENAAKIPKDIIAALLLIVGDMFKNREASVLGVSYVETEAVSNLLFKYRRIEV